MHWPVPGYGESVGVCLYKLISQTKRVSCPSSCFGSKQSARSGGGRQRREGPSSTWQNKMGPRRDSECNISTNKWAVYWDDTSERPTLCCLSCKFRHSLVSNGGVTELKKETRGETVSSCFVFRSGSDWNMGSNGGYKNQTLYLVLGSHEQRESVFTSSLLYSLSVFSDTHTRWLWWQQPCLPLTSLLCREKSCPETALVCRHLVYIKAMLSLRMWMHRCFCCHAPPVAVRRHQFGVIGSVRNSKSH